MEIIKGHYKINDVKRELDSEGKEKYVLLELNNAKDENILNSEKIMVSDINAIIRKN